MMKMIYEYECIIYQYIKKNIESMKNSPWDILPLLEEMSPGISNMKRNRSVVSKRCNVQLNPQVAIRLSTDDDGPIAIGPPSDSGDLKI